jgi:tetratricopeptide (TPR) repeat protein
MERIPILEDILKEDPNNTFTLFALAKEWSNKGDFTTAIQYFIKLKEIDDQYLGLYLHLGKAYEANDEIEKALVIFREGCQVATSQNDEKSHSELQAALFNLELAL